MALSEPRFLWFLLLLLPLTLLEARRARRLLPGIRLLWGEEAARGWRRRTLLSRVAMAFALSCFVLALTGPVSEAPANRGQGGRKDIAIVLDISRSMLAADSGGESRLATAVRVAREFLALPGENRFALIACKGVAHLVFPLTDDVDPIDLFLDTASPSFSTEKGSDQASGILAAVSALNNRTASERYIVLLSDGESLSGDPRNAALAARKAGIAVFAIGFGSDSGTLLPSSNRDGASLVRSKRNRTALRALAVAGGGAYASAEDLPALDELRSRLSGGSGSSAGASSPSSRDRSSLLALAGLSLLALGLLARLLPNRGKKGLLGFLCAIAFLGTMGSCDRIQTGIRLASAVSDARRGAHAEASAAYLRLLKKADGTDANVIRYDLALSYAALGQKDVALSALRAVAEAADPSLSARAYYGMGWISFSWGDYDQAVASFRKSLEKESGAVDALVGLELALQRRNRQKTASASQAAPLQVDRGKVDEPQEFDLIRKAEGDRYRSSTGQETGDETDY